MLPEEISAVKPAADEPNICSFPPSLWLRYCSPSFASPPLKTHQIKLKNIKQITAQEADLLLGSNFVVNISWTLTLRPFSSDVKLRSYKREKSELLSLPERWTVKIWRDKVKQHI